MAKILIVEDDEILQRMYQKKFVSEGYDVIAATDGNTALTLLQTNKPDLILLDIMLPGGMNGFDVLEQIKLNPETKDILVLIVTNLDSEGKVAKEIGASGYLVKVNTTPGQITEAAKALLADKSSKKS